MKTKTEKNVLAEKDLGHRNVMGTNWPRVATLKREQALGRTTGFGITITCNGTADLYQCFRTRRAAQAYFDSLTEAR